MAICEGMKLSGRGTTGAALLRAGCGAVYGYSQRVTFVGDYKFEETFWNVIKEEGTIAEAYATMVDVWGPVDPYGDAWPIVMSPVDDFPANPDQAQTVYCDWTLFGESEEPIALEGYTLSANEANIAVGETVTVKFNREPEDANLYDIIWTSSDENVAVVDGNKRRGKITGSGSGTAVFTALLLSPSVLPVMNHLRQHSTLKAEISGSALPPSIPSLLLMTEQGFSHVPATSALLTASHSSC